MRHPTSRARTFWFTTARPHPQTSQYPIPSVSSGSEYTHARRTSVCTYLHSVTMDYYPYSNWILFIVRSKYNIPRNRPLVCPQSNEEEGCDVTRQSRSTGTNPIVGHKGYFNWNKIKIPPPLGIIYTAKKKELTWRRSHVVTVTRTIYRIIIKFGTGIIKNFYHAKVLFVHIDPVKCII